MYYALLVLMISSRSFEVRVSASRAATV